MTASQPTEEVFYNGKIVNKTMRNFRTKIGHEHSAKGIKNGCFQ